MSFKLSKFTIARIFSRVIVFGLFILAGLGWQGWLKGDLSASSLFGVNLLDPFASIQLLLAGGALGMASLLGALLVLLFYALLAPRAFCGWVCPVGLLSDLASWLRARSGIKSKVLNLKQSLRYYLLGVTLVLSALLGISAFESVSFVGIIQRGLIFGGAGWISVAGLILLFDTFVLERGVCGHICPLGAFWALFSKFGLIKIHYDEEKCSRCGECERVCPERHVLGIVGDKSGVIENECLSCGRCVSVCEDDAIKFDIKNLRRK